MTINLISKSYINQYFKKIELEVMFDAFEFAVDLLIQPRQIILKNAFQIEFDYVFQSNKTSKSNFLQRKTNKTKLIADAFVLTTRQGGVFTYKHNSKLLICFGYINHQKQFSKKKIQKKNKKKRPKKSARNHNM
jgi:hypothetical protein